MDDSQSLLGLLNGIARMHYYNDKDISNELLKNELYPNLSEETFNDFLDKMSFLMKTIVASDMDFNQLEAYLTSQTKRRSGGITEDQAKVFIKFWNNHKNKIHNALVAKSSWNNSLNDMKWRIDIKGQTQNSETINNPVAIVELNLQNNLQEKSEFLRFEMDEARLTTVLTSMQEIEDRIKLVSQI